MLPAHSSRPASSSESDNSAFSATGENGARTSAREENYARAVVGAAIVDSLARPTHFLAAQRSYPAWADGLWEFPGGKVEPGETPEEAIHREIREELCAEIRLGQLVRNPASADGSWNLESTEVNAGKAEVHNRGRRMFLWLAEFTDPEAGFTQTGSHRELRYLDAREIEAVPWLPGDLQILPVLTQIFSRD